MPAACKTSGMWPLLFSLEDNFMNNFLKYTECFNTDLPIQQPVKYGFVVFIICSDKHNTFCALLKV